jgi:hypothetical protein
MIYRISQLRSPVITVKGRIPISLLCGAALFALIVLSGPFHAEAEAGWGFPGLVESSSWTVGN